MSEAPREDASQGAFAISLKGKTEPRIFTEPRRDLTPETSRGYEVIAFAKVCGIDLLPWQEWLLIHMLELNEDGTYRFRRVVILVGRQNGKTTLVKVLALWVMATTPGRTVLGVAQDLSVAKESWSGVVEMCEERAELANLMAAKNPVRRSSGDLQLTLANKSRYRIAAANGRAGRSWSVNLLILDELREMKSWIPYKALAPTTSAQADGMTVCISNAGEDDSVVLNGLREAALNEAKGIGIFEWSAPDGCELDDEDGWAYANPGLGVTVQEAELRADLATLPPAEFRTEHLCQYVRNINTAIDLDAWRDSGDYSGTMDALRERVHLCLDVGKSGKHVSLVAAAQRQDGSVRLEVVAAWDSPAEARKALPGWLERIRPVSLGWYPNGPAAVLAADLRAIPKAVEFKAGEINAIHMGFAEQVQSRRIIHSQDPLLNNHIENVQKWNSGDGWHFARRDMHDVDAVYAAAGAAWLARENRVKVAKPRIIVAA